MIRRIRHSVGDRVDRFRFALLRTLVIRLVPAVVALDEQDPILAGPAR